MLFKCVNWCRYAEGARRGDPVWDKIRETAKKDADAEPLLSSYMYMSILSHETLEQAISFVLANRLADSTLLPTQLMEMFNSVLFADDKVGIVPLTQSAWFHPSQTI